MARQPRAMGHNLYLVPAEDGIAASLLRPLTSVHRPASAQMGFLTTNCNTALHVLPNVRVPNS